MAGERPRGGGGLRLSGPSRVFRLLHAGVEIDLARGTLVIGRDASSGLVLEDLRCSRRHAQLEVSDSACTLTDLGSGNGTFVNGQRVVGSRVLANGDLIVIGHEELQLIEARTSGVRGAVERGPDPARTSSDDLRRHAEALASFQPNPSERRSPPPVPRSSRTASPPSTVPPSSAGRREADASPRTTAITPPRSAMKPELLADDPTIVTGQMDTFQVYGRLAEQALAAKDDARAAQILAAPYRSIVADAKRSGSVAPDSMEFMARYAVRLALATRDGFWIDATLRAFTVAKRPLPSSLIEELQGALRRLPPVDRVALRELIDTLRAASAQLSPSERFAVARLAGLEQDLGRGP